MASEGKVRRLEAVAAAHSELQAQVEPQQAELRLWRSALAGAAGAGSAAGPEAVLQLLEDLRGQVLTLKERTGEKEAEARRLQGRLLATAPVACLLLTVAGRALFYLYCNLNKTGHYHRDMHGREALLLQVCRVLVSLPEGGYEQQLRNVVQRR